MKFFKNILIILGFFLLIGKLSAQTNPYEKHRRILIESDTTFLDTLSIAPNSFKIDQIDTSNYTLQFDKNLLIWNGTLPTDSITVHYQTFPFSFSESIFHKDLKLYNTNTFEEQNVFSIKPKNEIDQVFNTGSLHKSGSITRGIQVGNNRDMSVTSGFDLRISGKLTEKVSISASVKDDNIPFQPEGNTAQIQDFDKVFIEAYTDHSKLTAGDFFIKSPQGYFLKFAKKAQGGTFSTQFSDKTTIRASAAISKGKFARNSIQGIEGNQGPYKLIGNENERFIIILSGTERVFIDGRLLQRGEQGDFTIDYNNAEVAFMPQQRITKDTRIVVEFQYSDRNYTRSLLEFNIQHPFKNGSVYFNAYSEQDGKNQPLQQTLDLEDRLLLSEIGDELDLAFIAGIDSTGFRENVVLYEKIDTLGFTSVYRHTTDQEKGIYSLLFTLVETGKGDYVEDGINAFGKIYKWVTPINGVSQGNYSPIQRLVTPKKQQMLSTGIRLKKKLFSLHSELAMSNKDINTFSKKNANDNIGLALFTDASAKYPLSESSYLELLGGIEINQKNFHALERFRSVEFTRDWNTNNLILLNDLLLTKASIGYHNDSLGDLEIGNQLYQVNNGFDGVKNSAKLEFHPGNYYFKFDGSRMKSTIPSSSLFSRQKSEISRSFGFYKIGIESETEKNLFSQSTDTLSFSSYGFETISAFFQKSDSVGNSYRLYYKTRQDRLPSIHSLQKSTFAEEAGTSLDLAKNKNHKLMLGSSFRILSINDSTLFKGEPERNILGNLRHSLRLLKGGIQTRLYYEVGSGLERKRIFSYLEVSPGIGNYTWIDYNEDNVKDLNEFELAQFVDQSNYIKIISPSDDFVKIHSNKFQFNVDLRPSSFLNKKKKITAILALLQNKSTLNISRKLNDLGKELVYNPFYLTNSDTRFTTLQSDLRNRFYINRTNTKFGMEHSYQESKNKSLLSNGFDTRVFRFNEYAVRFRLFENFRTRFEYEAGTKISNAEYTSGRDFNIQYSSIRPQLNYQPNSSFRWSFTASFTEKENTKPDGIEQASITDFGSEVRWTKASKGSISLKLNSIKIAFDGEPNSSSAFEMLNSLNPGNNIVWECFIDKKLSSVLQLSLNYQGRTSNDKKTIHNGGIQMRAIF